MNLRLLHRRLAVVMALAALLAFAGGAGFEPVSTTLAASVLFAALFWRPSPALSSRLERIWVPLAALLVLRALYHVFLVGDDIVIPVVDLLLLLLTAEALRSLDAANDARLYALSFALLLASAAYRPGILFAVAFLLYVVVGTVALFVGHLRRESERNLIPEVDLGRRILFGVAGLSGVSLTVAVGVFLTFPRVSQGWTGRGEAPAPPVVGFSDQVSLGEFGATIYGNPEIVLRVEFPDSAPEDVESLYWRGRSYDRFDGVRWSRSPRLPPALAPDDWYRERWGGERMVQHVYSTPLEARVLFGLHPILDLDAESRIQPLFDNSGDYTYWGSAPPVYRAESVRGRPSAEALRSADGRFVPAQGFYTQLPALPDRVYALADSLAGELEAPYDKVVAIRDWLRTEFGYTLELPASRREATLEHFLFERRAGHCEYFSTALAVLLRAQGIPARNVNGFLGGDWSNFGRYLAVTQNQAHSWVEVWFPDFGWVPFDATPAGSGGGATADQAAWFWPGRFLLDAVQHRWSKWVLDYNMETQWNLLDRASSVFSDEGGAGDPGSSSMDDETRRLLWVAFALLLALGAVVAVFRRRRAITYPTRQFLRLRRHARKAGFAGAEELPPLALLDRMRAASHPGTRPTSEFVDLYLRIRFGGRPLTDSARFRLADARRRAREALRKDAAGTSIGRHDGT
ncbi:MAG: transglutaminaseTgpA domain-containing protein [Longimicrobiales bacterium]